MKGRHILAGVALMALAAATCGGTDTTATTDVPTTTEVVVVTTTVPPTTTTTVPPTATTTVPPTTTTTSGIDLDDPATAALFFIFQFESSRDAIIEVLENNINIESVDKYITEAETAGEPTSAQVILDVTSGWASDDNQHDGAWEITKAMAILYEAPDKGWYSEVWVPDFLLTNSGRDYNCTGDFMVQLADSRKSMSDWDAECG